MSKNSYVKQVSLAGLFCATAYLFVFILRINVSFLTFDIKSSVIAVGALLLGPLWGVLMAAMVSFLEFVTVSSTGVYGLIMNFLANAVFAFVVSLIYKYRKKLSGAIIGLVFAIVSVTVVMLLANLLITPYYTGMPVKAIVEMILPLLLPFNAIKYTINAAVVLLVYKPLSHALKSVNLISTRHDEHKYKLEYKTVIIIIVSVLIIIAAVWLLLVSMQGSVEWIAK
ncbi:MAG: ECF transporter S component [bacterium]|nr:ECF transporter S component [bacterium]